LRSANQLQLLQVLVGDGKERERNTHAVQRSEFTLVHEYDMRRASRHIGQIDKLRE